MSEEEKSRLRRQIKYEKMENEVKEILKSRGIEGRSGVEINLYSIDEDEDSYTVSIDQTLIIKKVLTKKEEKVID